LVLSSCISAPASAEQPFEYKMQPTPLEGPVDPIITRRYTAKFHACQKTTPEDSENAADYLGCFTSELRRQDKALTRTWEATLSRMPTSTREALAVAQRQWIADREPFCKASADQQVAGGSIYPIVYEDCRIEQTIRRTLWLETLR
jgi:uncharacterized protein YecT (DUF1311 family)